MWTDRRTDGQTDTCDEVNSHFLQSCIWAYKTNMTLIINGRISAGCCQFVE
jgi:hypothetical protein